MQTNLDNMAGVTDSPKRAIGFGAPPLFFSNNAFLWLKGSIAGSASSLLGDLSSNRLRFSRMLRREAVSVLLSSTVLSSVIVMAASDLKARSSSISAYVRAGFAGGPRLEVEAGFSFAFCGETNCNGCGLNGLDGRCGDAMFLVGLADLKRSQHYNFTNSSKSIFSLAYLYAGVAFLTGLVDRGLLAGVWGLPADLFFWTLMNCIGWKLYGLASLLPGVFLLFLPKS